MNRRENFARLEEENPEIVRRIKFESFLKRFNEDYMEILEEDLLNFNQNLQSLYESGGIFRRLGRL